jgi:hypothetical protein
MGNVSVSCISILFLLSRWEPRLCPPKVAFEKVPDRELSFRIEPPFALMLIILFDRERDRDPLLLILEGRLMVF